MRASGDSHLSLERRRLNIRGFDALRPASLSVDDRFDALARALRLEIGSDIGLPKAIFATRIHGPPAVTHKAQTRTVFTRNPFKLLLLLIKAEIISRSSIINVC